MHLHHELQRALADTKIGVTTATPRLAKPPETPPRPEGANKGTRSIRMLFGHRPAGRRGRTTGTVGTGHRGRPAS
jgi:hypothetical protein